MIKKLQNLPLPTRLRVLWMSIGVVAIALLLVMYTSVSSQIKKVNSDNILPLQQNTPVSAVKYIKVEWVEVADNKLKIFFKAENTSSAILNFSKPSDVTLRFKDRTLTAEQLIDRQSITFPIKLLSNSEKYGIAIFEDPKSSDASIKFDQMFFEGDNPTFFHEELELDLEELNKPLEIRS
jgi:hypothetical protein